MQMIIPNTLNAWLIVACAAFALFVCFGIKLIKHLNYENKKHHFLVWNDNSIESLYDWDDEDDMI